MKHILSAIVLSTVCASAARAQLSPDRMYYGVDRPVPMTVKVPDGKSGDVKIELLEPITAKPLATAAAAAGGVNIATLFPDLWQKKDSQIVYAQLVVGSEKIGPAVVIQPLADRGTAVRDLQTGQARFGPSGRTYSGLRAWIDKDAVIETTKGEMRFILRADQAPQTVLNFMHLIDGGFYTDIAFHRIIGGKKTPFVVQVGDPTASATSPGGSGGPGYAIDLEDSKLPHDFGVLSMARTADPNSNGSQIFICLSRERCRALDGQYTSFGQLVSGDDALNALSETPVGPSEDEKRAGHPVEMPRIIKARTVDAAPYGTAPKPVSSPAALPPQR